MSPGLASRSERLALEVRLAGRLVMLATLDGLWCRPAVDVKHI